MYVDSSHQTCRCRYNVILPFRTLSNYNLQTWVCTGRRPGGGMFAAMGVVTGFAAHEYDQWYTQKKEAFIREGVRSMEALLRPYIDES